MIASAIVSTELALTHFTSSSRVLSITFDDGFLHGSQVACESLAKHGFLATFYVVTGWIEPARVVIREAYNAGRRHGDWDHWRSVKVLGHEVGSHTFSHAYAPSASWMPGLMLKEMTQSREDLMREIPQDIYTIAMPFSAASNKSERLARSLYSACRLGSSELTYNRLDALSHYRLNSWVSRTAMQEADYTNAIAAIPAGGWLILQLHSFDDEGWEPISRRSFDSICRFTASDTDVIVAPVASVIANRFVGA